MRLLDIFYQNNKNATPTVLISFIIKSASLDFKKEYSLDKSGFKDDIYNALDVMEIAQWIKKMEKKKNFYRLKSIQSDRQKHDRTRQSLKFTKMNGKDIQYMIIYSTSIYIDRYYQQLHEKYKDFSCNC